MKKTNLLFTLLTFLLIFNCSKAREDLSYLYSLKEAISENFETDLIKINISENEKSEVLNISIEDSKFNHYSPKKKQKMANNIGEIALKLRKNTQKTITGELTFVDESNYGIFKTSDSQTYNIFKIN